MSEFLKNDTTPWPHTDGLNTEVFKAFAQLMVAEGEVQRLPELGYRGDKSDLFVTEVTSDGKSTFHLYLFPQAYSMDDGSLHLATFIRVPDGAAGFDLRYDLRASADGGYVEKHSHGEVTADIDNLEKTEFAAKLEEFREKLEDGDPSLTTQSGWED